MSRILVVDDEPAIGWSLRELLSDQGHEVAVAASAEEALETCERFAAEAILLDVRLPGRDGIAAIPDLRSRAPAAPVVVMTAFGDLDTAVRAVQAGAFDLLLKPFALDRVSDVVARAVVHRTAAGAVAAAVREWSAAARRTYGGEPEPDLHHRLLKVVEAALIREALAQAGGNRTAAAKLLGLDRATLRTKLRLLGLDD